MWEFHWKTNSSQPTSSEGRFNDCLLINCSQLGQFEKAICKVSTRLLCPQVLNPSSWQFVNQIKGGGCCMLSLNSHVCDLRLRCATCDFLCPHYFKGNALMSAICDCALRPWLVITIFCIPATKNCMQQRFSMGHWATALDLETFTYVFILCI